MARDWGRNCKSKEVSAQVERLNVSRATVYAIRNHKKRPERYLFIVARNRARKYGLEFNLEYSDCIMPAYCPILGLPLEVHSLIRGNPCSASVDRIDNSKGYIKGNVQVISLLANQMKSTANAEQLLRFAEWVRRTYGG